MWRLCQRGYPPFRRSAPSEWDTAWKQLFIRHYERGVLKDEFATRRVWTRTQGEAKARPAWLILRIECIGDRTYTLSNAPIDTPIERLAEGCCGRYFVERQRTGDAES